METKSWRANRRESSHGVQQGQDRKGSNRKSTTKPSQDLNWPFGGGALCWVEWRRNYFKIETFWKATKWLLNILEIVPYLKLNVLDRPEACRSARNRVKRRLGVAFVPAILGNGYFLQFTKAAKSVVVILWFRTGRLIQITQLTISYLMFLFNKIILLNSITTLFKCSIWSAKYHICVISIHTSKQN